MKLFRGYKEGIEGVYKRVENRGKTVGIPMFILNKNVEEYEE